jgi:hypothetical protein
MDLLSPRPSAVDDSSIEKDTEPQMHTDLPGAAEPQPKKNRTTDEHGFTLIAKSSRKNPRSLRRFWMIVVRMALSK